MLLNVYEDSLQEIYITMKISVLLSIHSGRECKALVCEFNGMEYKRGKRLRTAAVTGNFPDDFHHQFRAPHGGVSSMCELNKNF